MSSLCKVLDPQQLMLIMKNVVCLLIQLNTSPGLFDPPTKKEQKKLPDNQSERVHDTMILNPKEKTFVKEVHFNSSWLLAATLAFYINRSFGKSCTMKEVRAKQLSQCITMRKYLSESERKAQLKCKKKSVPAETARKDPDDDDDPPQVPKETRSTVKGQPN